MNQFGRQIKVIGNTGSNSTREALHATEQVRHRCVASSYTDVSMHHFSIDFCLPVIHYMPVNLHAPLHCLQGFAVGMDAALQINPYYGKTSMTGLHEHFKCVGSWCVACTGGARLDRQRLQVVCLFANASGSAMLSKQVWLDMQGRAG